MGVGKYAKQTFNVKITFELTDWQMRTGQFLSVLTY
jgi:hypothetical protein